MKCKTCFKCGKNIETIRKCRGFCIVCYNAYLKHINEKYAESIRKSNKNRKHKRYYITRAKTLKRDICTICGEHGRYRLIYNEKISNGCISGFSVSVDHQKQIDGKKKYYKTCYIGRLSSKKVKKLFESK